MQHDKMGKKRLGILIGSSFEEEGPEEAQHLGYVLPPGVDGPEPFGPPPEAFVQIALHLFAQVRRAKPFQQAVGPPGRLRGMAHIFYLHW
jgi:hypothetical protein